jgi:hypothetical protein
LPARGTTVRHWLADPAGPLAGLLFLSDDSHAGTRRRNLSRERVRRRGRRGSARISDQTTRPLENGSNSALPSDDVADTDTVGVK